MNISDILVQIVPYAVSTFLNLRTCSSPHVCVLHFTTLTSISILLESFGPVKCNIFMRRSSFAKSGCNKKVYLTGSFLFTNINIQFLSLLRRLLLALCTSKLYQINFVESVHVEAMTRPPQAFFQPRDTRVATHDVFYTTNCTRKLHSKPLTNIQFRSVILFLLCNNTVILYVRSAPPQAHTAQLFIYPIQYRCALLVL